MGHWHVTKPEATENLFADPIAGAASPATYWTFATGGGAGASIAKSTAAALFGDASFLFTKSTSAHGRIYQSITVSAVPYTISAYIKRSNGQAPSGGSQVTPVWQGGVLTQFASFTLIRDGWYLCLYTATPSAGAQQMGIAMWEDGIRVGGIQLEQKSYHTTMTYGSRKGNLARGYYWTGIPHGSSSIRDAQERDGGRVYALSDYINIKTASGMGMPPQNVSRDKPAQLDGTIYHDSFYNERVLNLSGTLIPSTPSDLSSMFAKKSFLEDLVKRDLVVPKQPFWLQHSGGDITVQAQFFFEGGLDGQLSADMAFNEQAAMRLIADDPFWYALGNDAAALDVQDTLTTNYVIQKSRAGAWGNLATSLNGSVRASVKDSSGNLYLGGDMTAPGSYCVKWNGASLAAMDSGPGGPIHSLLWNGTNILAAGENDTIEEWDGAAWDELVLDLGANGPIYAVFANATHVYVGGDFTQIGGIAANNIARMTIAGGAWTALGSGTNGPVFAIRLNGTNLYVGGAFSAAGGVSNTNRAARWATGSSTWNALGTGVTGEQIGNGYVYGIDTDSSNNAYFVGDFSEFGGVSSTGGIAKWNGSAISAVGVGLGVKGGSRCIEIDSSNNIYVGGVDLGGGAFLRWWNGSAWAILPGGSQPNDAVYALYHDGSDLYIGGIFSGAGGVAGTNRICLHDGSVYAALDSGIDNGVIYSIVPRGTTLIIGGSFINGDGQVAGDYVIEWDGAAFQVMSTGLTGIVRAMGTVGGASDDVYIGGDFNGGAEGDYLTMWDDATYTDQASGTADLLTNDTIRAMVKVGNDLYLGGDFTTFNSISAPYILSIDVDNKPVLLSTGMNGAVYALVTDGDFAYIGGAFTTAGGTTVNYVAKFNPLTGAFSALGSGLSGTVRTLAIDPATGYLWAAGENGLLAYWNGAIWAELDTDTTSTLYAITFDDSGNLYIGGNFIEIAGMNVDGIIRYTAGTFTLLDIDLPDAATVYSILHDAGEITLGFNTAGTTTTPGSATVTNNGKALSYPVVKVVGPGTWRQVSNTTIKKNIYFNNLELASGEEVVLDLSIFAKTLVSNVRGDISGKIIQSDEDTFALLAGANTIKCFVTGTGSPTASIMWPLTYEDVAGASA